MPRQDLYTGLDIGSSHIRVVVGQPIPNGEGWHVLGAAESVSEGVSKGTITSIEDAVSSISGALEKVEKMTGSGVDRVAVSINGTHITSQDSHGIVAVAKADGEIKPNDIDRVLEAAQTVATPPNYEILHVIPRSFTVDSQHGIKDPIGMNGMRLEVDAQIIQGQSAQLKNLQKAVLRTNVSVGELVLAVMASAEACVTKRQKELGVAVVNIGAATTGLIVYEEGEVMHTKVLPVGGAHVTNDIAIGLRIGIDLAEKVKIEFGTACPSEINKRDEFSLSELGGDETPVSRKYLADIIEARVEEIFKMIDRELQHIDRSGLLPAGLVLTGGGAKLPGLVEVGKKEFRLPVAIGYPQGFTSPVEKINDPAFTTALGLLVGAADQIRSGHHSGGHGGSITNVIDDLRDRFKHIFRS